MSVSVPPGKQTFLDPETGALLALGTVTHYVPTTTTFKNTWADEAQTQVNQNPITLDGTGSCSIWGEGLYRQIVKDVDGNVIWDRVTGFTSPAEGYGELDTISDLRSLNSSVVRLSIVYVRGYVTDHDGGEGFFALDLSSGASDNGGTVIIDAAGNRWVRPQVGSNFTPWFGATGVGDNTAALQRALTAGGMMNAGGIQYPVSGVLSLGSASSLWGPGTIQTSGGPNAVQITGANTSVRDIEVNASAANQSLIIGADAADVLVSNVSVDGRGSSGTGNGITISGDGQTRINFLFNNVSAKAYAFLLNATSLSADPVDSITILGGKYSANTGDAVAINSPADAAQNVIVIGPLLETLAGAGNGGLGLSYAHVQGLVAAGFIIEESTFEGLHFEDGCRHGVAGLFVLRGGASRAGVYLSREGANAAESLPLVVTGFAVHGAELKSGVTANSVGFWTTFTSGGAQTRAPVGPAYIHGFDYAVWASGPGLHAHTEISVGEGNYALKVGGNDRAWTVAPGRYYSKGVDAFVYVNSGAAFDLGEFHQEGPLPNAFIVFGSGPTSPGAMIRGFSGKAPDCLLAVGPGYNMAPIFPEPARMFGRLTIWTDDGTGFGNIWSGSVLYDGATFTVADAYQKGTANFSISLIPTMDVSAGKVRIAIFNAGAAGAYTAQIRVRFDGEYYSDA